MILFISLIVLSACIILRVFPRTAWENFNGTDAYFHLYYIDLIKKNNHKIPRIEPRVLGGSNECTYPFFYHYLLSYFSDKFIAYWDKFSGFIFDFISSIILLALLSLLRPISILESCLIIASYIIAPGLTFSFIGPRPYSLTPRNFSQFIFWLACVLLLLSSSPFQNMDIMYLIMGILFLTILLLSSQFGTQVLLFILLGSMFYLKIGIAIIISAIFGILFFKGFLIVQIKAHIHHLEWYFKYNYPFVTHKSNFGKLILYIKAANLRGIFYELVFYNQFFTSILRHPTYFLSLGLGFYALASDSLNGYQRETLFLLIPLFIAFIITNFGKARVFGEAERYIEFAYPLQMFLFLSLVPTDYFLHVLIAILAYNLIWYFYNLYQIKHQNASLYDYTNLLSHIQKDNTNLLCLNNNESYIFLKKTRVNIVGFLVNISLKGNYKSFFEKFFKRYPFVNENYLKNICEKYNVNLILKSKFIKDSDNVYAKVIETMVHYNQIYEDERYVLYEKSD